MKVSNPVLRGYHPDPSVVRRGREYFLVTSSNEYAPGIPIYRSPDLVSWEPIGAVLSSPGSLDLSRTPSSLGIFAPTIRFDGERFVVTATLVGIGHFIVTATDPAGVWSEPVFIAGPGWDPSLCFEGDRVLLTFSTGHSIRLRELDPKTWEMVGEEHELWSGSGGEAPEAPHLYLRNGWWYLVIAEGGTGLGHAVSVARSRRPEGPWEPHPANPILSHRGVSHPFQAVGHADLVEAPDGVWWAVMLAVRMSGGAGFQILGRESFLSPVTWFEDWPVFGIDGRLPVEFDAPTLETGAQRRMSATFDDSLEGSPRVGERDPGWLAIRDQSTPWLDADANGGFAFVGTAQTIDDARAPAFLGRRQEEHDWEVSVDLRFDPEGTAVAGLVARRDEEHHYDLVIESDGGQHRWACARARSGSLVQELGRIPLGPGDVQLVIRTSGNSVRDPLGSPGRHLFFAGLVGTPVQPVGEVDSRYLSTEVVGGFTGAVIGMYASGQGRASATPAVFQRWRSGPCLAGSNTDSALVSVLASSSFEAKGTS